ncbi:MAG: creatininase family protein [Anaerolineales bacterium]|jgi:creatinine amidohydrolase
MDTRKIQYLRPDQILEEIKNAPVAYLPLGLLEWHGPHLPLGVDSFNAERVAEMAASLCGGLLMPTLYFGTERERPKEVLDWLGFDSSEWIVGMDFPANSLPSMYANQEMFALVVREHLRLIESMNFKVIVLVSGHAATNQLETLERLAAEFNAERRVQVLVALPFVQNKEGIFEVGHASRIETSVMLELAPETVDLSKLPSKDQPLKNIDFAVIDYFTFLGSPTPDRTVREDDDPRFADASEGEKCLNAACQQICDRVRAELNRLLWLD